MSKASTKAKDKYNENNYDRFTLRMEKGKKDNIKQYATEQGKSLNAYIMDLINTDIQKEK